MRKLPKRDRISCEKEVTCKNTSSFDLTCCFCLFFNQNTCLVRCQWCPYHSLKNPFSCMFFYYHQFWNSLRYHYFFSWSLLYRPIKFNQNYNAKQDFSDPLKCCLSKCYFVNFKTATSAKATSIYGFCLLRISSNRITLTHFHWEWFIENYWSSLNWIHLSKKPLQ